MRFRADWRGFARAAGAGAGPRALRAARGAGGEGADEPWGEGARGAQGRDGGEAASSSEAFPARVVPGGAAAAYVHIPFCQRRCHYCDFPISVVGSRGAAVPAAREAMEKYVALVLREVRAMEVDAAAPEPLRTVFFGGGTPSLLPPDLLEAILAGLDRAFGLDPAAEVSLEADPGTFSREGLGALRAAGVNRLSVGVQSFDAGEIEACGRAHSLRDALEAIDAVHAVGFPSWSLDLMSGLPKQTLESWGSSLEQALDAGPDHLSVYDLQVEAGTPFARWYEPGARPLPLEAEAAEMYRLASRTLRGAGFEHYEVSSYARPGHRCRHNQVYWSGEPFWAFGLGAASFVGGRRVTRPRKMKGYEAWVPQLEAGPMAAEPGPRTEAEAQAAAQDGLLDFVMLQLRLMEGLGLDDVAERAGGGARGARMAAGVLEAVRPHVEAGTARVCGEGSARRVQLADPEGLLVSNDIISDVFVALD